jgi:hypothetical protein
MGLFTGLEDGSKYKGHPDQAKTRSIIDALDHVLAEYDATGGAALLRTHGEALRAMRRLKMDELTPDNKALYQSEQERARL